MRGLRFLRCGSCRTLFVDPAPAAGAGAALYAGERYYANPSFDSPESGGFFGYKDYLADRAHIERKFERVLERLERHASPGRLLDVGSGPGFLLAAARRRGWEARGVDPNPWAVRHARDELGLDVVEGTLDDVEVGESYDALTMMDVIEHVSDPDALVSRAAGLTRPGGALAVLTPDAGSPVSRAMGRRWPEARRAPEHLVLFSAGGLEQLLRRHGWTPVDRHSIGKESSLATLAADMAPAGARAGQGAAAGRGSAAARPAQRRLRSAHQARALRGARGVSAVELSVLMPVFDERATVEQAIRRVLDADLPVESLELIVVDDGSRDGSGELLDAGDWPPQVKVLRHGRNRGKGAALRTALAQASGTWTTVIDADLEYDPNTVAELIEPLQSGEAEAVFGVRGFRSHSSYSFWYVMGNKAVTLAANVLYNAWLADIMTCHKVARTSMLQSLSLREEGFGIEPEITARLLRAGVQIYEVPVIYNARRREEGKKLTGLDGLRVLRTLFRCRVG